MRWPTYVLNKYQLNDDSSHTNTVNKDYLLSEIISDFSKNSIAYISGYIIRSVWSKI